MAQKKDSELVLVNDIPTGSCFVFLYKVSGGTGFVNRRITEAQMRTLFGGATFTNLAGSPYDNGPLAAILNNLNSRIDSISYIDRAVADIATRDALTSGSPPLQNGETVYVTDATDDPTVADGPAIYKWIASSLSWVKISEPGAIDFEMTAEATSYDNTASLLSAINVQDAIDELKILIESAGITVDPTPTDGSTNPVSSDGVFDALAGVQAYALNLNNLLAAAIQEEIDDINDELGNKSDVGHTHAISDVTGLQTALDTKAVLPDIEDNEGKILAVNATGDGLEWIDASSIGTSLPTGGTTGQVLKKNSNTDGDVSWQDDNTGGSGASIKQTYSYSIGGGGAGFVVGECVRKTSTSDQWTKSSGADPDTIDNSEVDGIIEALPTGSTMTIVMAGEITLSGLTPGTVYYLDPSTAGGYTATKPTSGIVKRLFKAVSATKAIVNIQSGYVA